MLTWSSKNFDSLTQNTNTSIFERVLVPKTSQRSCVQNESSNRALSIFCILEDFVKVDMPLLTAPFHGAEFPGADCSIIHGLLAVATILKIFAEMR